MNNNPENREEEIANEFVYRTSEPTTFDFASELLGLDLVTDADTYRSDSEDFPEVYTEGVYRES